MKTLVRISQVLAALALLAAAPLPAAAAEPVAVIVDPGNSRTDVSAEELRSIFLGKRRDWSDGTRIVALDLPAGAAARNDFYRDALGMEARDVEQYWMEAKIRGAAGAPREAPTAGAAVKLVSRVKGAVAYVPLSQVDDSVKVLTVDGVAPGKPGYRLGR